MRGGASATAGIALAVLLIALPAWAADAVARGTAEPAPSADNSGATRSGREIYRRFRDKAALVASVIDSQLPQLEIPDVGDTRAYGSIAEMVADPRIDAIWLTGPNHARIENVEAIVAAIRDGRGTLKDIENDCRKHGEQLGLGIAFRQTNREDELIDWVQQARGKAAAIVINPAGYGHTSIALLDALLAGSQWGLRFEGSLGR